MTDLLAVRCVEAPANTWGNTDKPIPYKLPLLFPESGPLMDAYYYFWNTLCNVFCGTRYAHLYVHGVPTLNHIQHKEAMFWWVQTIVQYTPIHDKQTMQHAFIQQWLKNLRAHDALSQLSTLDNELNLVNAVWEIMCAQAPKSLHE